MKYRVMPIVNGYRYKGRRYVPGEVIDLPEGSFIPNFLEIVKANEPKAPEVKPASSIAESLEDLERQDMFKTLEEDKNTQQKKPHKVRIDA